MANTTKDDKKRRPSHSRNCYEKKLLDIVGRCHSNFPNMSSNPLNRLDWKEWINKKVIAQKKYHYQETFQYEYK